MKKSFDSATELDGFDELPAEDQAKVEKAWEEGHVADDDIPESARKPEAQESDETEGKKKGKGKPRKREKVRHVSIEGFLYLKQEVEKHRRTSEHGSRDG